jgi:hypothetical protein
MCRTANKETPEKKSYLPWPALPLSTWPFPPPPLARCKKKKKELTAKTGKRKKNKEKNFSSDSYSLRGD